MAYPKPKYDAWAKLNITQEVLNAAQDVAATSIGRKAEYWERAVKFLSDLSTKKYIELSRSQSNWARGIRMDLEHEHGYRFR